MQLSYFDIEKFLCDYWQKKPLLIRNAWKSWRNPLEPDELAGLACEEEIESRLITQVGDGWNVENGPIPEARFSELGTKQWTLLVQAVNHYEPEVAALIEPFRFIPDWRIDDVMVSFAADGGGVGPHFDQYDVFLIQGLGKRRWQIGGMCDETSELLPHDDLRLLADFAVTEEWMLEPGDMLYVPPGFAHNGIADGNCMTYSIGFRAPARSELIGDWVDDLLADMTNDDRYTDNFMNAGNQNQNPAEISADAIDRLHAMITEKIADRDAFAQWFGKYNSTPKYPDLDWRPDELIDADTLRKRLVQGSLLSRNIASRFSFIRHDKNKSELSFFVDGQCFECANETAVLAEQLCSQNYIEVELELMKLDSVIILIMKLYNQGSVMFEPEGSEE